MLAAVTQDERDTRKKLSEASEELASLRVAHARETADLQRQLEHKERSNRNLEEEMQRGLEELIKERDIVRKLRVGPQ